MAKTSTPVATKAVCLYGAGAEVLRDEAEAAGLRIADDPRLADLILVYGGDGSLLGADRDFPDQPKLIIRRNGEFQKCPHHQNQAVLERIVKGAHSVDRLPRVEARARGEVIQGINDIVFHNLRITSGVRYSVWIDGRQYGDEIVGDGLVVATPFGSSAYYRSITKSVFRVGLGLAFNNSTESVNHLVLGENSVITIRIARGPAGIVADNMVEPLPLDIGDHVEIRLSEKRSEIWELGILSCRECRDLQGRPAGFRHV